MPPLVSGSFSNSLPTCLATPGMTSASGLPSFPTATRSAGRSIEGRATRLVVGLAGRRSRGEQARHERESDDQPRFSFRHALGRALRALLCRLHRKLRKQPAGSQSSRRPGTPAKRPIPLVENGRMFGGFVQPEFDPGPMLRPFVGDFRGDEDLCPGSVEGLGQLLAHPVAPGPLRRHGRKRRDHDLRQQWHGSEFRANPFGPVNARYVCFQRKRSIVAVDPLSGEPLWVRQDIPSGSEVFGDEQYLFVLPPGSDEASVYRAIDGQLLGTRKVPRPKSDENTIFRRQRWPATCAGAIRRCPTRESISGAVCPHLGARRRQGTRAVPSTLGAGRRVLTLFDPWQQKAVWPSRDFASGARVSVVGSEAVGVLEPGGHFVLVALADGRTIADVQLEVRPHFPADGPPRHADGRPIHRAGPRQPSAGQRQSRTRGCSSRRECSAIPCAGPASMPSTCRENLPGRPRSTSITSIFSSASRGGCRCCSLPSSIIDNRGGQ